MAIGLPYDPNRSLRRGFRAAAKTAQAKKPAPRAPRPPAGYYDPALDAAERAAGRGIGDLRVDTETGNQRASTQYTLDTGRLGEDKATSLADLLRQKTRASTDTAAGYRRLGDSQAQNASAAGVGAGGTFAAALAKRTANEGVDQGRISEDYARGAQGVETSFGRATADAGTNYQYGVDDRGLALGRGERENIFFGQDTAAQREFQAAQAGYVPPVKPKSKKPAAKHTVAQRVKGSGRVGGGAARITKRRR